MAIVGIVGHEAKKFTKGTEARAKAIIKEIIARPEVTGVGTLFDCVYYWNRMGRKGQRCRVLIVGKKNSCLVEFEDGFKTITSRYAIRKVVKT
jgi:hypothetical protein